MTQEHSALVVDTHALFWSLTAPAKLGPEARAAFHDAEQGQATLYLPSIMIAELYYLNAKLGRPLDFAAVFADLASAAQFVMVDFTAAAVLRFDNLAAIPEMHDRIIAGVALALNCPLITCDRLIIGSDLVKTVW